MELLKPTIRNVIITTAILISFIIIYNLVLNVSLKRYKNELDNKVKIAFPDRDKKSRDLLLDDYPKLENDIKNRMKSTRALVEGEIPKKDSALDVLMNISEAIPKSVTVDIDELSIDPKGIKISKIIVPKVENIQAVVSAFERSNDFKDVKQGTVKIAADGTSKEFDVSMIHKVD